MSQNGSCSTSVLCDKMFLVERNIREIKKQICCIPEYQYQDEGIDLGTPQTVKFIDFTGDGVTATFAANKITVNVPNSGLQLPNTSTISPTANVTLSGPLNRNIQVDVRISAAPGNSLTSNSDGLYMTSSLPYIFSTGLTDSSNIITANLSTGISGGQSAIGGTGSNENLMLISTSHANKGRIIFGTSAYDEFNQRLGIGTTNPNTALHMFNSGTAIHRIEALNAVIDLAGAATSQLWFTNGGLIRTSITNFIIEQSSAMGPVGSYDWIRFYNPNNAQITGTGNGIVINNAFVPTSGTAIHNQFVINGTIDQTGGANGITRSIYINSILTSAADHRALEINNSTGNSLKIVNSVPGSTAYSTVDVSTTWNTSGNPTAIFANIVNTASGSTAKLVDIQQGGVSRFTIEKGASGSTVLSAAGITITGLGGVPGGISLGTGATVIPQTIHSGTSLTFTIAGVPEQQLYRFSAPVNAPTTGDYISIHLSNPLTGEFDPVSGNATYTGMTIAQTINQTGTSSGITRGIHINPTLTSAVDYRAIEITPNSGFAIYQSGAGAKNLFAGTLRLTGLPTYADEAAATTGGLVTGDVYKTATGELRIKL